jgi:hypothetical protein
MYGSAEACEDGILQFPLRGQWQINSLISIR